MSSFAKKLLNRAQDFPQQLVYTWIDNHGHNVQQVDISTVVGKASYIANLLINDYRIKPGERVLLVFPPCMDFAYVFIGCLLANVIPVPVYPPNPHKLESDLDNFSRIINNCGAKTALTNSFYGWIKRFSSIKNLFNKRKKWPKLQWHIIQNPRQITPVLPTTVADNELAFIQYTSGSTSTPKGVMISYENIEHQLDFIRGEALNHCGKIGPDTNAVSWLPPYHDFGLITGILGAPYGLYHLYKMSPLTFLQNPGIWFETVAKTKAKYIAAPNFAYELAVRKTTHEQRKNWDLSHLKLIMSAAEPISLNTMQRFFEAFAVTGISPQLFCPAYGLAEHTIAVVSSGRQVVHINKSLAAHRQLSIEKNPGNHTQRIVGCGAPRSDVKLQIVDPQTQTVVNGIGEIWVDSPSKALGYYNNPKQSQETFHAQLANSQDRTQYLRTGDLGFMYHDELFITGRMKEVMILRGKNIYPQDIESTIRLQFPQIRPGGIAAFSVEIAEEEQLVVFAEMRKPHNSPLEKLATEINDEIVAQHKILCYKIVFAKPGFVLKTTSGKVRRRACCSYFQQQNFASDRNILYIHHAKKDSIRAKVPTASKKVSHEEIRRFLQKNIADILQIHEICAQKTLQQLGVDSIYILELKNNFENHFGVNVPFIEVEKSLEVISKQLFDLVAQQQAQSSFQQQKVPLTPAQHWFFSHKSLPQPQQWNVSFMAKIAKNIRMEILREAVAYVMHNHDVFSVRIHRDHTHQEFTTTVIDYAEEKTPQTELTAQCEKYQRSLNFYAGDVCKIRIFDIGHDEKRFFCTMHHLICDGFSMAIFMRNIDTVYKQLCAQQQPFLPTATSYAQYAQQIYTQKSTTPADLWTTLLPQKLHPMPVDNPEGVHH